MTLYATSVTWDDVGNLIAGFADNLLAMGGLLYIVWRVAKPHAVDFVRTTQANQAAALEQLEGDRPDTLAGRAKAAADATVELPRLREQLDQVLVRLRPLEEADLPRRVGLLEVGYDNHGIRLGRLESVMIDQLAGELRTERAERLHDQFKSPSEDQQRADRIRDRRRREQEQQQP